MPNSLNASLLAAVLISLAPVSAQAQGQPPACRTARPSCWSMACASPATRPTRSPTARATPREGWKELIGTMVDLSGAPRTARRDHRLSRDAFPAEHPPRADAGAGRRRDRLQGMGGRRRSASARAIRSRRADGSIWWAGQFGNLIGRIDPKTGEMKEYPLPAERDAAHRRRSIRRAAPGTPATRTARSASSTRRPGKITVYKMPDPAAKDPHTADVRQEGHRSGSRCSRATWSAGSIPTTGDIKLVTLTHAGLQALRHQDRRRRQRPGSPATAAPASSRSIPGRWRSPRSSCRSRGTTVRRLDIADDGMIWYVNSGAGPARPLQSEDRRDQGMAVAERAAVRIPTPSSWSTASSGTTSPACGPTRWSASIPKTETFQSWAIPSGNIYAGIIRHMRATRDGNLLIHQSSTNRIMQVTVQRRAAAR